MPGDTGGFIFFWRQTSSPGLWFIPNQSMRPDPAAIRRNSAERKQLPVAENFVPALSDAGCCLTYHCEYVKCHDLSRLRGYYESV